MNGHPLSLGVSAPASLEAVASRRRQLFGLLLLVAVLVAAGVVAFSYASNVFIDRALGFLDLETLRLAFVALAVAFALYGWEKERALSGLERRLIEQAVVAEALSARLHDVTAISRAGRAVASALSLEDALNLILASAQDLLGAAAGSVMLLDRDRRELRVAAEVGLGDEIPTVVRVDESVAGWVADFREPVLLRGDNIPPRFRAFVPSDGSVRWAMSAPLYARGEPVGVINVSVSEGDREYGEHEVRTLTVFAEYAAIAIANAHLFQRQREAARRLEEADVRRRRFLAIVTHDLKGPLTAVLGYTRLLRDMGDAVTSEQRREFTEVVEVQGNRMLEMLDELILAAGAEDGAPVLSQEPLDLRALVEDSVAAFRGVLGDREVIIRIPEEMGGVAGDPSAVKHMLANLLDNAAKYSPPRAPIEVAVDDEDGEVRVSVADRGEGIPSHLLGQVFDQYHRADGDLGEGGYGLGLFILRSLAEGQGGRAWAENDPRGGARVGFALPRSVA